jgi:hypothetical protein
MVVARALSVSLESFGTVGRLKPIFERSRSQIESDDVLLLLLLLRSLGLLEFSLKPFQGEQ